MLYAVKAPRIDFCQVCPNITRIIPGEWMCTVSAMKSLIGPVIRSLACSVVTRTGADQYGYVLPHRLRFSETNSSCQLATNFLLIEALQRFHQYYGNDLQIECPSGSGDYVNLLGAAEEIQHRIIHIFGRDVEGRRATNGGNEKLDRDPHFRDYLHFYEVRRLPMTYLLTSVIDSFHSSSTGMMEKVWGHRTRRDGPGWSRTTSCKPE